MHDRRADEVSGLFMTSQAMAKNTLQVLSSDRSKLVCCSAVDPGPKVSPCLVELDLRTNGVRHIHASRLTKKRDLVVRRDMMTSINAREG